MFLFGSITLWLTKERAGSITREGFELAPTKQVRPTKIVKTRQRSCDMAGKQWVCSVLLLVTTTAGRSGDHVRRIPLASVSLRTPSHFRWRCAGDLDERDEAAWQPICGFPSRP